MPLSCSWCIQSISGRPIMDFSHAVDLLRVKKDPFRDSGFPGVDVGHKPDISGSGESFLASHLFSQSPG